ncbi:hypothetical protein HanRHA438_Chr06g0270761 [Helianthus annuus]|nr:hypothetical protein HanIR_Chr06g0281231 [Helianthus annuus]KAJ0912126.1 hypothetical protein HanRHA438_Chr06g0270761 [Helianthus annuus]
MSNGYLYCYYLVIIKENIKTGQYIDPDQVLIELSEDGQAKRRTEHIKNKASAK